MVKCQECGAENQLTSIFCHSCGTKLNLDELAPEEDFAKEAKKGQVKKFIRYVISLIVFLAIVAVLVGLFLPVSTSMRNLTDAEMQKLKRKMAKMEGGLIAQVELNETEASELANRVAGLETQRGSNKTSDKEGNGKEKKTDAGKEQGGFLVPEKLYLDFLSQNYVRVTLKSAIFGNVPVYNSVVGKVSVPENDKLHFEVTSAKMGRIPLPGPLQSVAVSRIKPNIVSKKPTKYFRNVIKDVDITPAKATLTLP